MPNPLTLNIASGMFFAAMEHGHLDSLKAYVKALSTRVTPEQLAAMYDWAFRAAGRPVNVPPTLAELLLEELG